MQQNKTYDWLPGNSETFEVTFDYYTPRPHFIIATRNKKIKQYESLTDDQKKEVIKIAIDTFTKFKENCTDCTTAVLSQHCGTWYSAKENFHAHLCVNMEFFRIIFKDKMGDWPDISEILGAKEYFSNAMSYPKTTKPNYKDTGLKHIQSLTKKALLNGAKNESSSTFTDICFHPSERRVGFLVENKPEGSQEWFKVQKGILVFASSYKIAGCHVCLVLDDNKHGK